MSGPFEESTVCSSQAENLFVCVERLRRRAEEFQRTIEAELEAVRGLIEELRIRQAKRRARIK